jgi:hypothetical protein
VFDDAYIIICIFLGEELLVGLIKNVLFVNYANISLNNVFLLKLNIKSHQKFHIFHNLKRTWLLICIIPLLGFKRILKGFSDS